MKPLNSGSPKGRGPEVLAMEALLKPGLSAGAFVLGFRASLRLQTPVVKEQTRDPNRSPHKIKAVFLNSGCVLVSELWLLGFRGGGFGV